MNSFTYGTKFPKHLEPDSVKFSVFTTNDVKSLSIQPIVTSLTTDVLGHPVPGGLYDRKLGPSGERNETCGTCNENILNCPGHFSYVQLPVPVVNPIFHKVIGTILKYSCLSCFKMQLAVESRKAFSEIDYEAVVPTDVIKFVMEEVKTGKICIFCKNYLIKIQVLKNRILLTTRKTEKFEKSPTKSSVMSQHVKSLESQYVNPSQSRNYLRKIWQNEEEIIRKMAPILNDVDLDNPTDAFFLETVPVPPPNVRPMNFVNGRAVENPQTTGYRTIVTNALVMGHLISVVQKKDESVLASKEAKEFYAVARGNTPIEKLNNCWEELQSNINGLLNKENESTREGVGLKQIIEKKSGIIRQNMMGKRVNFAARSVITPDPNLDIGEVGVPEVFAKRLTYPVPVTPWNVEKLREYISNGPDVHPGAISVEMEDGTVKRINPKNTVQQESLFKILLTPHNSKRSGFQGVKIVHRHLLNGDVLLLNRQPTLHKPSIMAHRAKILKGEKTMRMHYSNCKAYNADFDGDEMNAHFPQDEVARSEGYNIAEVAQQYLVPKDGTPLAGLIQDFIIAGVRLTLRGRFVDRYDYQQLVFQALSYKTDDTKLLPPAILKPTPLWSGKQVLSTVIINVIPKGQKLINLTAGSKISSKAWQSETPREWLAGGTPFKDDRNMSEAEVIIRDGELLSGILDKTHYGPTAYGLAHCIYELYGGTCALQLLSSFTKLFLCMLQYDGFTLGVHDILTVKVADKQRKKTMKKLRKIGKEVMTTVLNLPPDSSIEDIVQAREEMVATDPKFIQLIDRQYKTSLDSYNNQINKICLPAGLLCKFPKNNLQLMVQSGAKGSTVNTMQISCLLGQIELEGKRPPIMISGRSLPSFPLSEFAPRAGGFIDGRFMTGIQPQEFFFHCMAGREGLIDTAVKTSRSGYLQRCLIKHLEGLHVGYDLTVRNSNGNVIQFLYGEDGLDISKAQFLNKKQMPFLLDNSKVVVEQEVLKKLKDGEELTEVAEYRNELENWTRNQTDTLPAKHRKSPFSQFGAELFEKTGQKLPQAKLYKMWRKMASKDKRVYIEKCARCPDPLPSVLQPDHYFGSTNERLDKLESEFLEGKKKKVRKAFDNMLKYKAMTSLCAPGEPVGLLAAQSIGEPSTQMTLNTFHFAGRGEMNVTLGIPRLREILMMASKNIKTPSMEIPFLNVPKLEAKAEVLRRRLTRVVIGDLLQTINVKIKLVLQPKRLHQYTLRFQFLPSDCCEDYYAPISLVLKHMKKHFFREMFGAIDKFSKVKAKLVTMEEEKSAPKFPRKGDDDDDDDREEREGKKSAGGNEENSSDEEDQDEEDAKQTTKQKEAHEDQDPEEEEEKMDVQSDEENEDEPKNSSKNEAEGEEEETEDVESRFVTDTYLFANHYDQKKKERWCELVFSLPMHYKRIDMRAILTDVAYKSVFWQTPNIKRAITYMKEDKLTLRTDGINLLEMFKYHHLLDLNKLFCNDIHKMADTYGIEAASKIIVKEVKDVFNVYGITVDPRHLSLIADYMTFNGTYEPMSRKGMEKNSSPLHQMSFESSSAFLKDATLKGRMDDLQNPSSCLMLGKPCRVGTQCFDLLNKLPANVVSSVRMTQTG